MLVKLKLMERVSIETVLKTLPDSPVASSRERPWRGVTVDVHGHLADYSIRSPAHDHHLICYCHSGGGRLVQGRGGVVHEGIVSAGMSLLMPAGFDSTWDGDAPPSARIRMPTALMDEAAEQIGSRSDSQFEMRNIFGTRDTILEQIALVLLDELDNPPHYSQPLIADSLSCALAAHLFRSYNALVVPERQALSALERIELSKLADYIDGNLHRPIGLGELAAIVNVSRFHFARLFKKSTGMTAISFVEQCRIRRAKSLITDTDEPLAEIARVTGFADQSHFTRRFHRHVGSTPAAFAREQGRRRPARRPGGQSEA